MLGKSAEAEDVSIQTVWSHLERAPQQSRRQFSTGGVLPDKMPEIGPLEAGAAAVIVAPEPSDSNENL